MAGRDTGMKNEAGLGIGSFRMINERKDSRSRSLIAMESNGGERKMRGKRKEELFLILPEKVGGCLCPQLRELGCPSPNMSMPSTTENGMTYLR